MMQFHLSLWTTSNRDLKYILFFTNCVNCKFCHNSGHKFLRKSCLNLAGAWTEIKILIPVIAGFNTEHNTVIAQARKYRSSLYSAVVDPILLHEPILHVSDDINLILKPEIVRCKIWYHRETIYGNKNKVTDYKGGDSKVKADDVLTIAINVINFVQ